MNNRQMSDRIGNIDERLVYQAAKVRNYRKLHIAKNLRRAASIFLAAALMFGSGVIGAVAFSKETVVEVPWEIPVEIPVEVYVPVPQELDTIYLSSVGLTIVIPTQWEGRYICTINDNEEGCVIYSKAVYESSGPAAGAGRLCSIGLITEEQLSPSELMSYTAGGSRYLFSTALGTFGIQYPSDVQYDPSDPDQVKEYQDLESSLPMLQFMLDVMS